MRTKIGDYLRRIRLDKKEILKDMADKLEVSSAFLSAVENGKKNMPESTIDKLKELYNLNDTEVAELKTAAMESQNSISIDMSGASESEREMVVAFARNFGEMDEDAKKKIMEVLNK